MGDPCVPRERQFLEDVMNDLRQPIAANSALSSCALNVVEYVLRLLGSRPFTHLSRRQAQQYLIRMHPLLSEQVQQEQPLSFFYDLGPGYHASIRADCVGLRFSPGLGELLAFRQISRFSRLVNIIYPAGVFFTLIIDDLCAWMTNDIPLELTRNYLDLMQDLIVSLGLERLVSIRSESAVCCADEYRHTFEQQVTYPKNVAASADQISNVSRFVGRLCTEDEVVARLARYQQALAVSNLVLKDHVTGIRMTQRASEECFGFRSFPGGDARLQSGEVMLVRELNETVRPVLVTNRNADYLAYRQLESAELPTAWPTALGPVYAARRRSF